MTKSPKLLLFDIDGTLISTHGIPRTAMSRVLQNRYTGFSYDTGYNFSGRTDWEIVEHLLQFDNRSVSEEEVFSILEEFSVELQKEISNGKKPLIHPGVEPLLEKLAISEDMYLGLVTGNISKGASIKLSAAGLYHHFPIGGFGDDAKNRRELPRIAIDRAQKFLGIKVDARDTWIIGDSIYDIDCAQINHLRCLAVCTGWTSRSKLEEMNPEFIVESMEEYEQIIDLFRNQ